MSPHWPKEFVRNPVACGLKVAHRLPRSTTAQDPVLLDAALRYGHDQVCVGVSVYYLYSQMCHSSTDEGVISHCDQSQSNGYGALLS